MKNLNKILISVLVIAVLMPAIVFGATMKAGEEVSVKEANIQDNLYVAGGTVSIDSNISGDLFTAGGSIIVSGDTSDDMAIAGGSVTVIGNASGDMRIAGGNIIVTGDVTGDLIITGGSMTISSDVTVGKDLVVAGGQVSINGDVMGDVRVVGGVVTINGNVKGNVTAEVDDSLTLGENAVINGNLDYKAKSDETLKMKEGAVVVGETTFDVSKYAGAGEKTTKGLKYFFFVVVGTFVIFKLLASIIVALILVWLFKKFSNSVVKGVVKNPLIMLGKGFVAFIVVPVASIILFATLFGVPLGFMAMLSYGLVLIIACIYTGIVTGAWVSKVLSKSNKAVITWKNVIGGIVLLTVVKFIPFIGWIIGFLLFLITLGSIIDMLQKKIWGNR